MCPFFENTSFLLFLNKRDIFEEKIKTFPLKAVFPDYKGGSDYAKAIDHVRSRYMRTYERAKRGESEDFGGGNRVSFFCFVYQSSLYLLLSHLSLYIYTYVYIFLYIYLTPPISLSIYIYIISISIPIYLFLPPPPPPPPPLRHLHSQERPNSAGAGLVAMRAPLATRSTAT